MKAKVFIRRGCAICKSSLFHDIVQEINNEISVETFDVDELDGLAELASFGGAGLTSLPAILFVEEEEDD